MKEKPKLITCTIVMKDSRAWDALATKPTHLVRRLRGRPPGTPETTSERCAIDHRLAFARNAPIHSDPVSEAPDWFEAANIKCLWQTLAPR